MLFPEFGTPITATFNNLEFGCDWGVLLNNSCASSELLGIIWSKLPEWVDEFNAKIEYKYKYIPYNKYINKIDINI